MTQHVLAAMASEGAYPDPGSGQVGADSKPFYSQKQDANLFSALQSQLAQSPGITQPQPTLHDQNQDYNHSERLQAHASSNAEHHSSSILDHHNTSHYQSTFSDANNDVSGGSSIAEDALRAAQQSQQENQNLAQRMMSLDNHDDRHAMSPDGQSSARAKRNKVSRACDECRRKKIRCDASENDPLIICSNCKRTGARCQFSRMPMKRGPSKGYIKELADKIDVLENRLGPPAFGNAPSSIDAGYAGQYGQSFDAGQDVQDQPRLDFAAPSAQMSRKRTHSISERDTNGVNGAGVMWEGSYGPGRSGSSIWDQRQLPPLSGLQNPQTPNRDANLDSRQQCSPRSGSLRYSAPDRQGIGVGAPYDVGKDNGPAATLEWDENVIDEYAAFRSGPCTICADSYQVLPHNTPDISTVTTLEDAATITSRKLRRELTRSISISPRLLHALVTARKFITWCRPTAENEESRGAHSNMSIRELGN